MQVDNQSNASSSSIIDGENKFINLLLVNGELKQATFTKTIICYITMGIIFAVISVVAFSFINSVKFIEKLYYDPEPKDKSMRCNHYDTDSKLCQIKLELKEKIEGPVYVMYRVGNFYQNHKKYIQSKNRNQLEGKSINPSQAQASCTEYTNNEQMKKYESWGGTPLLPNDTASPCGIIAYTFFNDTFTLIRNSKNQTIFINETGLTYEGQKGVKYKKSKNSETQQWINPEDEHFIVWMRTSGLPNFEKLWGKIEDGLEADNYTLIVKNNYDSGNWEGKRYFILTNTTIFGGKNISIGVGMLVVSLFCFGASFFFYRKMKATKFKE